MRTENYTKEELQKAEHLDRCIAQINVEENAVSMLALDLEMVEWLNEARDLLSQIKENYEKQIDSIKLDKNRKDTTRVVMHKEISRLYGMDTTDKSKGQKVSLWRRVSHVFDRVVPKQEPELVPAYRREDEVSTLSLHGDQEAGSQLCLVATLNDKEIRLNIPEGDSIIGTSSEADIQLRDPDRYISGKHAKISRQDDQLYITDLNSTNGTYLDGEKLQPGVENRLKPGDRLMLATTPVILISET